MYLAHRLLRPCYPAIFLGDEVNLPHIRQLEDVETREVLPDDRRDGGEHLRADDGVDVVMAPARKLSVEQFAVPDELWIISMVVH